MTVTDDASLAWRHGDVIAVGGRQHDCGERSSNWSLCRRFT